MQSRNALSVVRHRLLGIGRLNGMPYQVWLAEGHGPWRPERCYVAWTGARCGTEADERAILRGGAVSPLLDCPDCERGHVHGEGDEDAVCETCEGRGRVDSWEHEDAAAEVA